MDESYPTPSRRRPGPGGPGRPEEGVSAGRAPAAPLRAAIRGVLAIGGLLGVAWLVGPGETPPPPCSNAIGRHPGLVLTTAMSPDGRRLASGGYEGSIRIWDVAGGDLATVLEPGDGPVHGLAWSPDGSALAAAGSAGAVTVWDANTWGRVAEMEGEPGRARGLAWSPDGTTLAAGCLDATVVLWDAASRRPRAVLRGHSGGVNLVHFSADGRTLVTGGSDGLVGTWDMPAGKLLRLHRAGVVALSGLAGTPGGDAFATCNIGPGVFRCRPGEPLTEGTALRGGGPYVALATSRDGRLLAASTIDGAIDLWRLATPRRLATLRGHYGTIRSMAFTPDGRSLLSGGSDGAIRTWRVGDDDGPGAPDPAP
ncbi:WD domain, G-beta repeat [Aquisphaera giovannonii]|uniref:WD domain, G-beta repeat n=1 Tax=Aquisphaera giovannonii TaxID=406548 RepID=A0A5B9WGC5_9BACT|nr:WD40 repeat domain-containing protein [Aquisphaera giovannonii]QEH39061.1 WD domain, G-beta repeat [Aquisphaera giovannonii]